ncbi:hypothetical protein [Croceiramulus getboli]|nr:hypothetical protein P8624_02075 [Flavobacteriaceae bacterium YJPT1-3]
MKKETFIRLLEHPQNINEEQTKALVTVIDQFPYFQPARSLYLKGLKNQDSFIYNAQLKTTAAYTVDRSILFEYITSDEFMQNEISDQIKRQEARLRAIEVHEAQDVSGQVEREELAKANQVLDPQLFVKKPNSDTTPEPKPKSPEEQLNMGKPIPFNKKETHSFFEWLSITRPKPIDRSSQKQETSSTEEVSEAEQEEASAAEESKARRQQLIDQFISNTPKIVPAADRSAPPKKPLEFPEPPAESLMTETLARVYLEQKNYKKAKQAYRILSLKYPEKSGFFADQIRAVEQIQEKHKNT